MDKTVSPGQRAGKVTIPSSKSVVHRLLICAALGKEPVKIPYNGLSKDILATVNCLRALGADISVSEKELSVLPVTSPAEGAVLPCGESGSTLRFLLPVVGALAAKGSFLMEGRLPERPMQEYEAILSAHGMQISREGNLLHFEGQLEPGYFILPGNISSQYFSGLLLALPLLPEDSELHIEGKLESAAYISLTEDALGEAGITLLHHADGWHISGGKVPSLPKEKAAEGDWSNAAFFLCAGALSEKGIRVEGLNCRSHQGDRAILELLQAFGAHSEILPEQNSVTIRKQNCRPLVIDASPIPDLIPVLAVLSCAAVGDTLIYNATRLRMKESDRLSSTAALIRSLGGSVEEKEDALIIHGTGNLHGGHADSFNDHRIAMSAAVAASLCSEAVTISAAESVEKSYPGFWDDWKRCTL